MICDELMLFSEDQEISGSNLFTPSTNTLDLSTRRDIADMDGLCVQFRVTEAFVADTGTPQIQFGITFADTAALDTNATTLVLTGGTGINLYMVASTLPLNAEVYLPIPRQCASIAGLSTMTGGLPTWVQRYMGVSYWCPAFLTTTFGAGKVTARIVRDIRQHTKYLDGIA